MDTILIYYNTISFSLTPNENFQMWVATHISDSEKTGIWMHWKFFKMFLDNEGHWFFYFFVLHADVNENMMQRLLLFNKTKT